MGKQEIHDVLPNHFIMLEEIDIPYRGAVISNTGLGKKHKKPDWM
jgi:hypothetical protein